MIFPLETPPPEIRMGEQFTSGLYCLQRKHLAYVSVFGKRLSRKSNNVVVFLFAFHSSGEDEEKILNVLEVEKRSFFQ
jgi:hypothetical protein